MKALHSSVKWLAAGCRMHLSETLTSRASSVCPNITLFLLDAVRFAGTDIVSAIRAIAALSSSRKDMYWENGCNLSVTSRVLYFLFHSILMLIGSKLLMWSTSLTVTHWAWPNSSSCAWTSSILFMKETKLRKSSPGCSRLCRVAKAALMQAPGSSYTSPNFCHILWYAPGLVLYTLWIRTSAGALTWRFNSYASVCSLEYADSARCLNTALNSGQCLLSPEKSGNSTFLMWCWEDAEDGAMLEFKLGEEYPANGFVEPITG